MTLPLSLPEKRFIPCSTHKGWGETVGRGNASPWKTFCCLLFYCGYKGIAQGADFLKYNTTWSLMNESFGRRRSVFHSWLAGISRELVLSFSRSLYFIRDQDEDTLSPSSRHLVYPWESKSSRQNCICPNRRDYQPLMRSVLPTWVRLPSSLQERLVIKSLRLDIYHDF